VQGVGWHVARCVLHRILPVCAVAVIICSLPCCSSADKQKSIGTTAQSDPVAPIRSADLGAHFPTATGPQVDSSSQLSQPLLFPGSAIEPAPPSPAPSDSRVASADPAAFIRGGGIELNFDGADIQSVAKSVLGDTLGVNFVVDPRVQGNVTLASTGPISRNDVLPVFESALRMSNVAVVREGNLLKVVPIAEATGTGAVNVGAGQPGFGVSVVPLHYTSATTIAKMAENFLSRPGAIKVDQARNLVLIQGTTAERQATLDVVAAFDVEWMRNQSVGVYPLKSTSPETMIRELERVFESSEGGQGQGMVRFQPVQRMNAVLMVTKNPKYLERATQWVQRLDRSDTSGTTVRVYRLKYGSAPQVAKILNQIFVVQGSGSNTGDTPASQIAPGMSAARSRLDSLGSANNGSASASSTGTTTAQNGAAPGAAPGRAGPIAAAFENFDNKDRETETGTATSPFATSTDSAARGVFQNVRITPDTADNAIVVYSNQEDYRVIERALREIDRPRLQVAIDATVAEVTLTDALQFGVQYFFSSGGGNSTFGLSTAPAAGLATTSAAGLATTSAAPVTGVDATAAVQAAVAPFLQGVLPGANLLLGSQAQPKVILSALSTLTDVKVLSAPSVVVMDNQPALLEVGDQIPISTGSATILSNSNNPVVNTIEMRNTGIILKVLPHVYANGTIQMEVEQEISNVVNSSQPTLTPTISQRRVHSTIAVNSGQTVLLGGLISDQNQKTKSGIPVLNDIPVVGDLFGTKSGQKQRTEIIMFIKPRLIRNSLDARSVAEEFRSGLELMREGSSSVVVGKGPPR
jgi:general secretion pathway protein D